MENEFREYVYIYGKNHDRQHLSGKCCNECECVMRTKIPGELWIPRAGLEHRNTNVAMLKSTANK